MTSKFTKEDKLLFSPAVSALGRIHWTILRAVEITDKDRFAYKQSENGFRVAGGFTDFGEEVGLDEIQWWVFKKERNRTELWGRTQAVLLSAHALERESAKLRKCEPQSYKELLTSLRTFCDSHSSEINALLEYVAWLESRDPRAPRILFTYRIWGSTRMADRTVKLPAENSPNESFQRLLAEIVLGVRDASQRKIDQIHSEIAYEIYVSSSPRNRKSLSIPRRGRPLEVAPQK